MRNHIAIFVGSQRRYDTDIRLARGRARHLPRTVSVSEPLVGAARAEAIVTAYWVWSSYWRRPRASPNRRSAQINSLSFKGFNYVSYYNGGYANANSLPALVGTGANAVALAFEYGIDVKNSAVYADANYTDSSATIAATIAEANSHGLKVMVRPLIDFLDPTKIGSYGVGDWRSTYNPTNAAAFFASYKTMIVGVAQMAQANGAAS